MRFLRDHAGPLDRAMLLSAESLSSEDLLRLREVSGIAPYVDLIGSGQWLRQLLDPQFREGVDLVVLPRTPPIVSLGAKSGPPMLILPPLQQSGRERERTIDVPDLIDDGALIRARLEYAIGIGHRTPIADQEVAFVRAAEVVARATSRAERRSCPPVSGVPWVCSAPMGQSRWIPWPPWRRVSRSCARPEAAHPVRCRNRERPAAADSPGAVGRCRRRARAPGAQLRVAAREAARRRPSAPRHRCGRRAR